MKRLNRLLLTLVRKVYCKLFVAKGKKGQGLQFYGYVEKYDQTANDLILEKILSGEPLMVSKFGTVELDALVRYKIYSRKKHSLSEYFKYMKGEYPTVDWIEGSMKTLCSNAGFFPNDYRLLEKFYSINVEAMKHIDVLGSYIKNENFFEEELQSATKVNLDGYYAPFYYHHPWTVALKGKKVLVVHPFADDIKKQYLLKRNKIWENSEILPPFELITYKAVQSMLGIRTEFATWFDALEHMESDISKIDFDIALIGCGAYGMPLAAFVKDMGKQAIHLAGWTQVLFGIIGTRWLNNPRVSALMNEAWIHPSKANIPAEAKKIENGCYW